MRPAAMLAAMTAPLAARGMKVGALMGSVYLFTEEIVAAGAIVPDFQEQSLGCRARPRQDFLQVKTKALPP